MLTQETKRKIDSCRDILVGKVPDPKAQVEQITTALIYKFMDDMDKSAIELGGKARFFTKGYEKYSWSKLMDSRLGGQDRLNLYVEAITSLSKNPHIPQLFRDIFNDAFLPYRNPETLGLFLKDVNGFSYDHSEDLGDAFEYLLSILGSQGDAGQFRTPRHIIDFIVAVVDPKKDETICDPACGTAGFLISAYKHINSQHDGKNGKALTPDEKKKLMQHFVGYDISPDMVRLSKVNMYLHGFADPKIFEYDTLSSEERWDDSFDVILANPPFMTPKGGIRPHKRFRVQANRAEVLFVDYIMEHLRPNGRAGIIVPEGVIFQSGTAYKALRKALIEDGLFAVVSLPAGVFNPYSGVKTSILFFDNTVAKKTDKVLFVRVLNDGFDLGAQRRPIDRNDLVRPDNELDAIKVLKAQRIAIETETKNSWLQEGSIFTYEITKEQISRTGDYNLSAERYRLDNLGDQRQQKWPMVELKDLAEELTDGDWIESKDQSPKGIRLIQTGNIGMGQFLDKGEKARFISEETFKRLNCTEIFAGDILVSRLPDPVGRACIVPRMDIRMITAVDCTIIRFDRNKIDPRFFLYYSKSGGYFKDVAGYLTGASRQRISRSNLAKIKIPLPPIDVQKEILEQIESKQEAIEHAKAIIKNLERERADFGRSLRKLDGIPMVELTEICKIQRGGSPRPIKQFITNDEGGINWIKIGDTEVESKYIEATKEKITVEGAKKSRAVKEGDLILSNSMSFGRPYIVKTPGCIHDGWLLLSEVRSDVDKEYLYYILMDRDTQDQFEKSATGGVVRNLNADLVKHVRIPLPELELQKKMVEEMEREEEAIATNRRLIETMEKKISDVLSEI